MTKSIAARIAVVVALSGVALATVPAMAQSVLPTPAPGPATIGPTICTRIGPNADDPINDSAGQFANRLNEMGYKVSGVENFGNCLRAYLTEPDGRQVMAYFNPDTLQRIIVAG